MTSRSYCFTLNNYTEEELKKLKEAYNKCPTIRYIIFGFEIGAQGTPHLQGYIELKSPTRATAVKTKLGSNRYHLEIRKGTRDQAADYCKKDGKFEEYGDFGAGGQGTRTDIKESLKKIKIGVENLKKTVDIIEEDPTFWCKNLKFAEKMKALYEKEATKEFRDVEVTVLYGDAGVGKTRTVHNIDKDVFTANCDDSFIFEGYDGEQTILLDDFNGQIKYKNLLRILDGHQYRCNVKGSHTYARWKKVFITTNEKPDDWYKYKMTPALQRRLNSIVEIHDCKFKSVQELMEEIEMYIGE